MTGVLVRLGGAVDIEPAVSVWRAASSARRGGLPVSAERETRVRSSLQKPDAFLLVADDEGEVVGMALGMQGLADDGTGPPVPGYPRKRELGIHPGRPHYGLPFHLYH